MQHQIATDDNDDDCRELGVLMQPLQDGFLRVGVGMGHDSIMRERRVRAGASQSWASHQVMTLPKAATDAFRVTWRRAKNKSFTDER